jgi:hypothetical protein
LRAVYDSKGKDGIETNGLLDSQHLFEMIFGAGGFESYVGELSLLSLQESLKGEMEVEDMRRAEVEMKRKQKKRELTCALKLASILDNYLTDESEDHINFKTFLKQEAQSLTKSAFGGTLIGVVVLKMFDCRDMYMKNKQCLSSDSRIVLHLVSELIIYLNLLM